MGAVIGVIVFLIVFLVVLGAFYNIIERGAASRLLRPYIGLFLIAALVAALGMIVGALFGGGQSILFFIARVIAALTCAALCLHLIVIIGKKWL